MCAKASAGPISWLAFPPPALFLACLTRCCYMHHSPFSTKAFGICCVVGYSDFSVYHLALLCVFKGSLIRYDTRIGPGASCVLDKHSTIEHIPRPVLTFGDKDSQSCLG